MPHSSESSDENHIYHLYHFTQCPKWHWTNMASYPHDTIDTYQKLTQVLWTDLNNLGKDALNNGKQVLDTYRWIVGALFVNETHLYQFLIYAVNTVQHVILTIRHLLQLLFLSLLLSNQHSMFDSLKHQQVQQTSTMVKNVTCGMK